MSVNANIAKLTEKARSLTGLDLHAVGWSTSIESHWRLVIPAPGTEPDFWTSRPMTPDVPKAFLVPILKSVLDVVGAMQEVADGRK